MPKLISNPFRRLADYAAEQHIGNMAHLHRKIYGRGGPQMKGDRVIEACYERKYANMIIEISKREWMHEMVQYVTAVNWLERSVAGLDMTFGLGIKWTDEVRQLPNMTAPALIQWINDMFIQPGSSLEINIHNDLRKSILRQSGYAARVRLLQGAKKKVASDFCTNQHNRFESHMIYIQNVWNFNSKFRKESHRTDTGGIIRDRVDVMLNDGMTYDDVADSAGAF